jgi:hypothetical protein
LDPCLALVRLLLAPIHFLGECLTIEPVVYEIKCVLDDVLNTVENVADGLLNGLAPALHGIIDTAKSTTCKSGLQIVGICLLG